MIAALASAPAAYGAAYTVTGTGDGGTCSGTSCPSIRAAIAAAEQTTAADTIAVPAGVVQINNDLLVQSEMTINGADARKTIVDGGAKYRLRTTANAVLTLNRFTIRNGAAGGGDITDGGGIYNAGRLNLQDVRVTQSTAARGGGIANGQGLIVADNLLVDNNVATGAGGGGGILNVAGQELPELKGWLILTDSTIFKNTATGSGGVGGLFSTGTGASVSLSRSTLADNTGGTTRGIGGLAPSGSTQVVGSIVARNLVSGAIVNCGTAKPTDALFNVEDDTDCALAPGGMKPQLATALSDQGGQVDVLTIPTASDAFNRMPFGDTPCESTDQRGLSRPQGTACDAGAFEIDQPATVTITEGPSGTITSTSTQFNFQANEPGVTVQCDLTGPGQTAGWETCYKENAQPYTGLADGPYTFSVRAVSASFPNPAPASRSFVVNAAGAPNTTINSGPSAPTNVNPPTFTFSSSESGSTFQCRFDNGTFTSCASPFTPAALGQGAHTFEVRATDAAGVPDPTPATRAFTTDTVVPDTIINTGPTGTVASTSATFTYTSPEAGVSFQCALDSTAYGACPVSYTGLAQGQHTFRVRASDAAGNTDATPAAVTWTVDTVAPTVTIDASPARTNDTTPSFTFSANEAATFQCRTDAGTFGTCTSPYTTAALAEGTHAVEVRASDPVGNQGAATSRAIVIDTTPPAAPAISAGPTGPTNDNTPTFSFTGEASASFECRVDTAAFAACTSPHTTAALADGARTFEVRARDAAGNAGSGARRSFNVDTAAPAAPTITTPAENALLAVGTVDIRGTAEANTTVQLTEGAVSAGSSPVGGTGLWNVIVTPSDGTHTYTARTVDAAGNQSSTVTRTIRIDTQLPDTTIVTGPSGTTGDTTPTWTFTSSESGSTFECALDGAAHTGCPTPYTAPTLSAGQHTLSVRAVDPAGNRDNTPATRTIVVDTSAPTVTLTGGPTGPTNDTTPTFTFTAETGTTLACRVDAAAFATCSSPHTTAVLAAGAHTFEVRATDPAGNSATDARSFSIDTTAPNAPVLEVPTVEGSTVSFAGTAEAGSTVELFDGASSRGTTTANANGFWSRSLGGVADGSHTYTVRARDAAGNQSGASAPRTVLVDTGPPAPPLLTGPSGPTNDNTPTFTFTGEPGASFGCSFDGSDFADCASPFTFPPVADGTHTLRVVAIDTAGNASENATRTFTVDTTQPAPPDVSGPAGPTTDPDPAFAFTAAEPTVECRLDGPGGPGTFGGCTSPARFSALAPGDYVFLVRTTDAAGNQATTQRAFTVTQVQPAQPTPEPPTQKPAQTPVPTPVPDQVIVVAPATGTVLVKAKGETKFTPLDVTKGIPLGSEVDVRKGRVTLTSIPKPGAAPETADFYGGMFIVTQKGGITDLKLSEPLTGCPSAKKASLAAKKTKSRKLWGNGKGAFRTSGNYSAATVRGTIWLVQDNCTSTLTRVTQGVVQVNDFVKKTKVLVKKGKRYTARARR